MKTSAGVLVFRRCGLELEFLLAHPGGPLWSRRDAGAWGVPKGVVEPGEAPRAAALREFAEETGLALDAPLVELDPIRQAGGKRVLAFAAQADLDLGGFSSNTFEMEWPPRSGRRASFPEIDRLAYFAEAKARTRILPSQAPLIDQVLALPQR